MFLWVLIVRPLSTGNLAWRTSWQDLKDKFREVGTVVYANVVKDDGGRSKGWGIVEFETPEEVRRRSRTDLSPVHCPSRVASLEAPECSPDSFKMPFRLLCGPALKHVLGGHTQAVQAVNTLNGTELGGRKLLVREDREDRDVKQYNRDNGLEGAGDTRPPRPRRERRGEAHTFWDTFMSHCSAVRPCYLWRVRRPVRGEEILR